jgi:hypothetical protein
MIAYFQTGYRFMIALFFYSNAQRVRALCSSAVPLKIHSRQAYLAVPLGSTCTTAERWIWTSTPEATSM